MQKRLYLWVLSTARQEERQEQIRDHGDGGDACDADPDGIEFFAFGKHTSIIIDMWGKIKTSLSLNILIGMGAVGALIGLFGIAREMIALRAEYAATQAKIEALRVERARLSARIAELATSEVIEREAKEKLNLKKKGERVVVVVPERPETRATSSPAVWWSRVRSFFGGMF